MKILKGDCLDILPTLDAESVDAVVTDPPYGLKFMGKDWDHSVPGEHFWREILRVAKPGAHLLAFGGTRTYHRLVCAIEDAGWEIRDTIAWVYGSGFPKSLDVSKAIDREAGADRKVVGRYKLPNGQEWNLRQADDGSQMHSPGAFTASGTRTLDVTAPSTEEARKWSGWGTALKPAFEPIVLARKPLVGTVAANVQEYGTGALNIDGCRVETGELAGKIYNNQNTGWKCTSKPSTILGNPNGRWPANFVHDGSEEVVELFPETISGAISPNHKNKGIEHIGTFKIRDRSGEYDIPSSSGSAARFFYTAKASRAERNHGLSGMRRAAMNWSSGEKSPGTFQSPNTDRTSENFHPTVKPISLMTWICRLITPPGGVILDPFMGSGSTGVAAKREGFDFLGIELDPHWCEVAKRRIGMTAHQKQLFTESK